MNRRSFVSTLTAVLLAPLCVTPCVQQIVCRPPMPSGARIAQDIFQMIASATGIPYRILVGESV